MNFFDLFRKKKNDSAETTVIKTLSIFKKSPNKHKQIILESLFDNDLEFINDFESYIKKRCGAFDKSFYSILNQMQGMNNEDITWSHFMPILKQLIKENSIPVENGMNGQLLYDLMHCYFRRTIEESEDERILRLKKAGFNVKTKSLMRDESKHKTMCSFEGKEDECPKSCDSCSISIKTDGDKCQVSGDYAGAIQLLQAG